MKLPYLTGRFVPVHSELLDLISTTTSDLIWLDTSLHTPQEHTAYLFTNPVGILRCDDPQELLNFFQGIEQALKDGLWLAGWFCYEFGYLMHPRLSHLIDIHRPKQPLALLLIFKKPIIFNENSKLPPTISNLLQDIPPLNINDICLDVTPEQYAHAIARIKQYICAGDSYQVNYTLRSRFQVPNGLNALSLYLKLREMQPVSYGAFMRIGPTQVLSCSPELFFKKIGEQIITRPMKGTAQRGKTLKEDMEVAQQLQKDIKNRAENIMIVDLLRNDLGRIAEIGSVKVPELFRVERYSTLFQMTSTIQAKLPRHISYEVLLRSLFPCGSVTGAPKLRTMEIIAELEGSARGIYTGAMGFISPHGTSCFNVAIRTLVIEEGQGELGIGSGVTIGSDSATEHEECRLKAAFLLRCSKPMPSFELLETMLWDPTTLQDGIPLSPYRLLSRHLKRMSDSAHYFDFPWDQDGILERLKTLSHELQGRSLPARVRLTLNRHGKLTLTWQDYKPDTSLEPVVVSIATTRTCSTNVFLYHKTTFRPLYDAEYKKAILTGCFDCIFLNEREEVTEGAITNIFIQRHASSLKLLTPPVSCGLLNGTLRQELLDTGKAVEATLSLEDCLSAHAVFVGNSVRGLKRGRILTNS